MSEVGFLVGREVIEVRADPDGGGRIIFELGERPEPALYADVGTPTYEDAYGNSRLLSSMRGGVVAETSTEGGTLVLSFPDGSMLRCEPHPAYGAWQVVGGAPQHVVVCTPGGELAVWDSSHVPTAAEAREAIERLKEITGWDVQVVEITETGGIIVAPESGSGRSEPPENT